MHKKKFKQRWWEGALLHRTTPLTARTPSSGIFKNDNDISQWIDWSVGGAFIAYRLSVITNITYLYQISILYQPIRKVQVSESFTRTEKISLEHL